MTKEHEYRYKVRLLRIQRMLLERPFAYTKAQLAARFNTSPDAIKDDLKAFREAGFETTYDENYCYGFIADRPYEELKDLLHFTEEEQQRLLNAIDNLGDHTLSADKLKRKIVSIYDFARLGNAFLRKPYLSKVDLLLQAKREKRQVVLLDYHSSNSNSVRDRRVEPFSPNPDDDILQAYDVDVQGLRHFRISRITRIQVTNDPWQYEGKHQVQATDPFRIVNDEQEMVHLRLKVGARNELVERFPMTQAYITPDPETADLYDFQCKVNKNFYGLSNFILGFHQFIEVLQPESLFDHLKAQKKLMNF